jgi:signal peptidase II
VRGRKVLGLITISGLLAALDQVVKGIVRSYLTPGESLPLLGDLLRITYAQNLRGFSWWVPPLPGYANLVLTALLGLVLLMAYPVYLFYVQTRQHTHWADVAVVAIAAATCGQLLDSQLAPYVVDFIQVFRSPSANLADLYIYVGCGALVIEAVLSFRLNGVKWKGARDFYRSSIHIRHEFLVFCASGIKALIRKLL